MLRKILFLAAVTTVFATNARIGTDNTITTATADGRIIIVKAINANILKITNVAVGEQPMPSRAVVLERTDYKPDVATIGKYISTLSTSSGITATVDDRTGFLTISAGQNKVFTDNGERPTIDGRTEIALSTTSVGSMYGAGERGHKLNLRGDTLGMYNTQNYGYTGNDPRISQMNITMPMFVSSDGYALLFDDFARSEMILGSPIKYITDNPKPVTYYFINGSSTLADVTEQLSELTGRQDLPPFWSLGYITSKYGYRTQDETLGVVDTLKRNGYPVDGLILDLYWYGVEQDMGRLAWDPEQWPNPEKMLRQLKEDGVNVVTISQPFMLRNGRGVDNYNALRDSSMLVRDSVGNAHDVTIWVGEGGMLDVSNPKTRTWLRNRYKQLTDMGVTGWWGDLGEPEQHPLTGFHANGLSAPLYHNQYGNDWSEIIYNLFKEEYPDTRLMTLMRAGTIGLQRYSVFPWSTDVSRSWGGLEPQVRIMIGAGLSGLGYMGHDVGGFAVDPENAYIPELYVRWLQLGLFSPVLRTHAQQFAEPYKYPEQANIIKKIIKERYRWLPYNYTLAWENTTKGYPLVRPLNFTEPGVTYDNISDEFLWGENILVAPVMTEAAVSRNITFPAGQWLDMANPCKVYEAHSTINYPAPLEVIPTFVKAGSFIPMADYQMENTGDYNPAKLTVNYYPVAGVDSEYVMFDDDRTSTNSLSEGNHRLITFSATESGKRINIKCEGSYTGAPSNIELTIVIHRASAPATMRINGRSMKPKYNSEAHTLTMKVKWPVSRSLNIESNNLTLCSQE